MKLMPNRVMIFIDGNNLYHAMKESGLDTSIDFYKFGKKLAGRRELVRGFRTKDTPRKKSIQRK